MSDFVNTIDLLGDQATADAIVSRTITDFKDDALPVVAKYKFYSCENLTSIDLPSVKTIDESAFQRCTALASVNLPNVVTIYGAFKECRGLTSVVLPKLETFGSGAFYQCSNLVMVDAPMATSIASTAFNNTKIATLILRGSAVCELKDTSAFGNVSNTITVYVPYDWIDAYENATNWSSLVASDKVTFEALEGSEYD